MSELSLSVQEKKDLKKYSHKISAQAKRVQAITVKDDETLALASDEREKARTTRKAITDWKKTVKDPYWNMCKFIEDKFKVELEKVKKIEEDADKKIVTYVKEKEKEQRAAMLEAQKLEEEKQRKLEEEKKKKEQEAIETMEGVDDIFEDFDIEDTSNEIDAQDTDDFFDEIEDDVSLQVAVPVVPKVKRLKTIIKNEIVNPSQVPRELCVPCPKLINAAIKASKELNEFEGDEILWNGIRIYKETKT